MRPLILLLSAAALGATACTARETVSTTPPVADSASIARAQAAANALAPDLAQMLMTELKANGPVSAVAVCADSAQARTATHSTDGLLVRRVGTRVRNPANAPDSLETRLLAYLQEQKLAGAMPQELMEVAQTGENGGWELRYLRPIALQEFCTTCHGDPSQIPSDVKAIIAERYPDDQAVGYAVGDLRGAVAVRVALPAPK